MRAELHHHSPIVVCGLGGSDVLSPEDLDLLHVVSKESVVALHYIVSEAPGSLIGNHAFIEMVTSHLRPTAVSYVIGSAPQGECMRFLSETPMGGIISADDRIDVPLYGLMHEHDEQVGFSDDFDAVMKAAGNIRLNGGPPTRFILPLGENTVDRVLALWHWLVQEGLPFAVTLQNPLKWDQEHRFKIMELLENLGYHPSVTFRDQLQHRRWLADLIDDMDPMLSKDVYCLGDTRLAQKAVSDGWVAPSAPSPPMRARMRRFFLRMKLDKAAKVALGSARILADQARPVKKITARAGAMKSRPDGSILITGWYGTETAGDKAILAGILKELASAVGKRPIGVASLLPFYTEQTLLQLGLDEMIEVIPYRSARLIQFVGQADLVIVGGGPLMDLVEMHDLVGIFQAARRAGAATAICGCGVGPANWPTTKLAIKELVRLSDRVVLRDHQSLDQMELLGASCDRTEVGLDPSINYLSELPEMRLPMAKRANLVLGLGIRDWPAKFAQGFSKIQYRQHRAQLKNEWSDLCDRFIEEFDGEVWLIPMHTLHIGDDDRWFQADILSQCRHRDRIRQYSASYSVREIASIIYGCDFFVSMRYHSMLFAASLGIPTIVVDYTRGGKVFAFARRHLPFAPLLDIADLDSGRLMDRIRSTSEDCENIRGRLDKIRMEWPAVACRAGRAAAELIGI